MMRRYAQLRPETRSSLVDLLVILIVTVLAFTVATSLDLFEHILAFVQDHEALELDELVAPMVLLPVALALFSLRRWRELRRALDAREKAEERLAASARLEGVVLAARTMQHEINNQLGIAVGYSEILALDETLTQEQREMASHALEGSEAAVALLVKLRMLTRLDVHHVGAPDGPILELRREGVAGGTGQQD